MRPPELLPLFPLPDHVLLPGLPVGFRIFEPRYRALVADLAELPEDQRWLAVPRLMPGWEPDYEGKPAIFPVAAAALARRIERAANGEFHISVEGLCRCELIETPSEKPYRLARPSELSDAPESPEQLQAAMAELLDRIAALGTRIELAPQELSRFLTAPSQHAQLVDRLAAFLINDPDQRQAVLECRFLSHRMRLVRDAATAVSTPPARSGQRWRPSTN